MTRKAAGIWVLLFGLGAAHSVAAQTADTPIARTAWVLTWRDEFDGARGRGVDTSKWRPDTGDGCQRGICGWGNQEKEYYSGAAANARLDGHGHLMILARRAPSRLPCYYGPCRYTSARITTRGKVEAGPGRVEARIKLPAGQGLWPAFWLLGADYPRVPWPDCGELDIMESHGSHPGTVSSAIHGPGYFGQTPFVHALTIPRGRFADAFHTFAVVWDSVRVQFFVDDSLHYTVERSDIERRGRWVFDKPFFIILNLAVGGTFDGDPKSDRVVPATMLVDYVRVYRRRGSE